MYPWPPSASNFSNAPSKSFIDSAMTTGKDSYVASQFYDDVILGETKRVSKSMLLIAIYEFFKFWKI